MMERMAEAVADRICSEHKLPVAVCTAIANALFEAYSGKHMEITRDPLDAADSNTQTFLDCSTGHLTQQTREWLDARAMLTVLEPEKMTHWVAGSPYGWFIYADEEPSGKDFPADLIAVMKYARAAGCAYILFDRDAGDPIEGLAWYES
jgi:hypothetical protein